MGLCNSERINSRATKNQIIVVKDVKKNNMKQNIKCIVWDLDDTLWNGTLAEDATVVVRREIRSIIENLDKKGILHSIASRNSHEDAMARLRKEGLDEYFLYPQITWGPKSESIETISRKLNLGLDTFVFVDDQEFERDEVSFNLREVWCLDSQDSSSLEILAALRPKFVTDDSAKRRQMYLSDAVRNAVEESFEGPKEAFLASLGLRFRVTDATVEDLHRAEELTVRTNQLNTTGITFSYEELKGFLNSKDHMFWIADLDDRYGTYGKIGLALIEVHPDIWRIRLLLMSCRVMARGVGNVMINLIREKAKKAGVRLQAEFIETDRNRMMYMTYKFANFIEVQKDGSNIVFENQLEDIAPTPSYLELDASRLKVDGVRPSA